MEEEKNQTEEKIEQEEKQENELLKELSLLKEKLQEEKKISEEYLRHLQYLKADFENYKKRVMEEKSKMWDIATEAVIGGMLPIVDNLEKAITSSENSSGKEILEGINIIYRQLKEYLQQLGISEINAKNEIFDPDLHEAVMYENSSEYPHGFILEEIQKGYKFKDRVIRPSKVKVVRNTTSEEGKENVS